MLHLKVPEQSSYSTLVGRYVHLAGPRQRGEEEAVLVEARDAVDWRAAVESQ